MSGSPTRWSARGRSTWSSFPVLSPTSTSTGRSRATRTCCAGSAAFTRLILLDKRGTGLSDRVGTHHLPSLETRMDDVRAVLDAVGSERAALLGASEGGPMAILFAATYPRRTRALLLYGSYALSIPGFCLQASWKPPR